MKNIEFLTYIGLRIWQKRCTFAPRNTDKNILKICYKQQQNSR